MVNFKFDRLIRCVDCHSGLCARIIELVNEQASRSDGIGFEALWSGSLASANILGLPDTGVTSLEQRLEIIRQIRSVSKLPIVFDAENGTIGASVFDLVKRLDDNGVNTIVFEDREGAKSNSYAKRPTDSKSPESVFLSRVAEAVRAKASDQVIVARLEGLIFGNSIDEVVSRALLCEDVGVDAVLLHSKSNDASEVLDTANALTRNGVKVPLVAVPTTYSGVNESELYQAGFRMVVYANQLLRSATKSMEYALCSILENEKVSPIEPLMTPIPAILDMFEHD